MIDGLDIAVTHLAGGIVHQTLHIECGFGKFRNIRDGNAQRRKVIRQVETFDQPGKIVHQRDGFIYSRECLVGIRQQIPDLISLIDSPGTYHFHAGGQ